MTPGVPVYGATGTKMSRGRSARSAPPRKWECAVTALPARSEMGFIDRQEGKRLVPGAPLSVAEQCDHRSPTIATPHLVSAYGQSVTTK